MSAPSSAADVADDDDDDVVCVIVVVLLVLVLVLVLVLLGVIRARWIELIIQKRLPFLVCCSLLCFFFLSSSPPCFLLPSVLWP